MPTPEVIRRLPKAELHTHLDSALRPETMIDLARQAKFELPVWEPEALRRFMVVKDAATLQILHSQPSIQTTMARFDSVTVAAVAVGSWTPPESQLRKTLDDDDLEHFKKEGVVGEVLATLLRADGSILRDLDSHATAMDYPHMQKIPKLMLVAGGETKSVVVRAALRARIGNMLVTDQNLARRLLADA